MNNPPFVSICSITYNHAPYIRQCLDGMLMQQTNFAFEIIINDDCSTDGTTEIIREYATKYPDIIKPIFHEENLYQKGQRGFFSKFVFPKAQGKYIALCEGDDYWTDSLKLQKQVNFLETHPDYSLCFHNAIVHYEEGGTNDHIFSNIENREYFGTEIYKNWIIPTCSVLFLKEVLYGEKYLALSHMKGIIASDTPLFICCSFWGKIRGLSDIAAIYRKHHEGIMSKFSSQKLTLLSQDIAISKFFSGDYINLCKKKNAGLFIVGISELSKDFKNSLKLIWRIFKFTPYYSLKELFHWIPKIIKHKICP